MIFNGIRVDVNKVVENLGLEYRSVSRGREVLVKCPFETHGSGQYKLYVNLNTGLWECKACPDKQGGLVKLVALTQEITYGEAANLLVEGGSEVDHSEIGEHILDILRKRRMKGIRKSDTRKGISVERYREMIPMKFYPWRSSRKFNKRTVKVWNLGYVEEAAYPWIIPVIIRGEVKYLIRRAKKTVYEVRGEKRKRPKYHYSEEYPRNEVLFGLEHSRANRLVLTEGPLDCISVWQALDRAGLLHKYAPVAIGGDAFSETQAQIVAESCDGVIIFYDNDEPGRGAANQTIKKLRGKVDIRTVDYSLISQKDPGEMSPEDIIERIDNSVPLTLGMIRRSGG